MTEYWVWLSEVLGSHTAPIKKILEIYGDAKSFYDADDNKKAKLCGLTKSQFERLHKISRKKIFDIINDCKEYKIRIALPNGEEYPERLLGIPDPPVVLYIKGKKLLLDGVPSIAIVGPRKISDYGKKSAYVIAGTLASCGMTVVSGGAIGGDSHAHRGAIESGGFTVGVLGGGIECGYLKSNEQLRNSIVENGCLVSEFSPKTPVTKGSFPRRNRIVSGLSDGVVVIEGGKKSGTLITARHASEQGKDVFVIPGNPSLAEYEGSNRLMVDGAKPLLNINDIIDEYLYIYPDKLHNPTQNVKVPQDYTEQPTEKPKGHSKTVKPVEKTKKTIDLSMLTENAGNVLKAVKNENITEFTVDDVMACTNLSVGEIFAAITELEIMGAVAVIPGGRYKLVK
jgi:DNA processing protein